VLLIMGGALLSYHKPFVAPWSHLVEGSWPHEGTKHGTTTGTFWSNASGCCFW
jgi:hypothetical protein